MRDRKCCLLGPGRGEFLTLNTQLTEEQRGRIPMRSAAQQCFKTKRDQGRGSQSPNTTHAQSDSAGPPHAQKPNRACARPCLAARDGSRPCCPPSSDDSIARLLALFLSLRLAATCWSSRPPQHEGQCCNADSSATDLPRLEAAKLTAKLSRTTWAFDAFDRDSVGDPRVLGHATGLVSAGIVRAGSS